MDDFKLAGTGLEAETKEFVAAMKLADAELGGVLERQIVLLLGTTTDEQRKRARSQFNAAVKAELVTLSEKSE